MAIIDTVKLAARIKGNTLDSEITRLISWARAEMVRAGVPGTVASSETNELVTECAIQGVLMHISTDEKIRGAAEKAFLYQLDCMRKRSEWPEDPEPEPTPDPTPDPDPDPDPNNGGDPNDP